MSNFEHNEVSDAQPKTDELRQCVTAASGTLRLDAQQDYVAALEAITAALDQMDQASARKARVVLLPPVPDLMEFRSDRMIDAIIALHGVGMNVVAVAGAPNRYRIEDRERLDCGSAS